MLAEAIWRIRMNTNPVPVVCVLSFQDPEAAGFLTSALLLLRVTPLTRLTVTMPDVSMELNVPFL